MCTAMTYQTKDFYFGRTLDYDYSYGESITITPRRYPFVFRYLPTLNAHHAIIGMAHVENGYPLYYDAVNEKGLCMAGLNFPYNAVYQDPQTASCAVTQFELIPWVLSHCANVTEAKQVLQSLQVVDAPFSAQLPPTPLHWIVTDQTGCLTLECVRDGMHVYDNPVGVLTNNPPFERQLAHLETFSHLTNEEPHPETEDQTAFSRGRGAVGLPGDLSSPSRFVRAAFTRRFAVSGESEQESVTQFFHMLGTVEQTRGCCKLGEDRYEITLYTSCCNATRGIYYYTTYHNPQISAVDLCRENLEDTRLISYPLLQGAHVRYQN